MQEFGFDGALLYDHYDLGVPGDLDFYVEEAIRKKGTVLELGAGTGRILIPIAEHGIHVTGLDRSKDMLDIAQQKIDKLPEEVQDRIQLYEGDMQSFRIPATFDLILIPHRAFLHMLTPAAQKQALECIKHHLKPDGQLIFNVIEPTIEEIAAHTEHGGTAMRFDCRTRHPVTGNTVVVWYSRQYYPATQRIEQYVIFEELDDKGRMINKSYTPLVARYSHRAEMEHLLELCGFEVEELYGNFDRQPWNYGDEQVWVAKHKD